MIVDLQTFIRNERPYWEELEALLGRLEKEPVRTLPMNEIRRFHYLYERVSSDLARMATFSVERETGRYLERLVARAYGEIHEIREKPHHLRPIHWFLVRFPVTFRRHLRAFQVSTAVTLLGCIFGAAVIGLDPAAKELVMPFEHLLEHPSDRVSEEERVVTDRMGGAKAQMAAWYIQNNTKVAITAMALGVTWGIGTLLLMFSTGIMLGAVFADYMMDGQAVFLFGWLLPHGAFEIPAILLAGQAGLVLAAAMIGWGNRTLALRERLRSVSPDLATLIGGVAVFLVWAGIVESFLSQYHEPTIPYWIKIAFGAVEILIVVFLLAVSGRRSGASEERPHG